VLISVIRGLNLVIKNYTAKHKVPNEKLLIISFLCLKHYIYDKNFS